jgi:hypothetical protein
MRAKKGNVRSLVFKHGVNGFSSPDPDFDLVRHQVAKAIDETVHPPKKAKKPGKSGSAKGSGGSSSSRTSPSPQSESAADACAFDPQMAANAQPPG